MLMSQKPRCTRDQLAAECHTKCIYAHFIAGHAENLRKYTKICKFHTRVFIEPASVGAAFSWSDWIHFCVWTRPILLASWRVGAIRIFCRAWLSSLECVTNIQISKWDFKVDSLDDQKNLSLSILSSKLECERLWTLIHVLFFLYSCRRATHCNRRRRKEKSNKFTFQLIHQFT